MTSRALTPAQQAAIDRLYEHNATILVAATGAGKSVICLTAIKALLDDGELNRVIIACPAKLVSEHTHRREVDKWKHLTGLRVFEVAGPPDQRERVVRNPAGQVLVVSLNNLDWLLDQAHGCDGIVIDELSKAAGKQTRALRKRKGNREIKWRVGMTATPVSQNFLKLYDMCRIIDHGKALGTNKTEYEGNYFKADYNGYNLELLPGADAVIAARVAPLVHLVEDTKASSLPPIKYRTVRFDMAGWSRVFYDEMKADLVAKLPEGGEIEAANQAVKSGKLRQIASGFTYSETGCAHHLDFERVQALGRVLTLAPADKTVIFYEYTEQLTHLQGCNEMTTESVEEFINGPARYLLAQFNSLGHGVDGLQDVCHDVVFYHPLWSRDATEQAVGRVWRQGQTQPVTVTTLVCNNTLDDVVMERVAGNAIWMEMLTSHLTGKGTTT